VIVATGFGAVSFCPLLVQHALQNFPAIVLPCARLGYTFEKLISIGFITIVLNRDTWFTSFCETFFGPLDPQKFVL
jgi:hypothetical protein